MLLFVDESGQDNRNMPCEVLAGVAIPQPNLWNLIKAIRSAEKDHFGDYLRNLRATELKARKLLKRKGFRLANRDFEIEDAELPSMANAVLVKGMEAHAAGRPQSSATPREITGYWRSVLRFVDQVLTIAANHDVRVLASVVDANAARSEKNILGKEIVYLFERYFYLLEECCPSGRGLVVFDELEKTKAHKLIQRMAAYFLGTRTGQFRSSRIVPEPFFVHSELTTGIFLADVAAYVLGWAWRLNNMPQPCRDELKPLARKLHRMQYQGQKPHSDGSGHWPLYGICYLDDLRGKMDRLADEGIEAEGA